MGTDTFREKAPSRGLRVAVSLLAVVSLAGLIYGGYSLYHSNVPMGVAGFVVGFGLFGLNYVLKQKLGHDIEVNPEAIVEHAKPPVRITWSERPHIERIEMGGGMQSTIVKTSDGRKIRIDTVFGSPIHNAVSRYYDRATT